MHKIVTAFVLAVMVYLPIVGTARPDCTLTTFEDGSSIKECVEVREELPALCTYAYDEFGDLVFWDCSSRG